MTEPLKLECYDCGNFLVPPIYSEDENFCEKCGATKFRLIKNELLVNSIVELGLKVKCHLCDNYVGTYMEYLKDHHPCVNEKSLCKFGCGIKMQKAEIVKHEPKCKRRTYTCHTCKSEFTRDNLLKHFKESKHKCPKIVVHTKEGKRFALDINFLYVLREQIYEKTEKKSFKISMVRYGQYGAPLTNEDINDALMNNTNIDIFAKLF